MRTHLFAILFALFFAIAATAAEPTPPGPTPAALGTSPASLCDDLCRRLYAAEPANLALCKEGCEKAERCTNRCEEQFPNAADELARCNYLCARAR